MSRPRFMRVKLLMAASHLTTVGVSIRQLSHGQRLGEVVALRKVDADAFELREYRFTLHTLGDRGNPERAPDLADGLDHAAVDGILRDVSDELSVDLQE